MSIPKTRICTTCKRRRPLTSFNKKRDGKYGRTAKCKKCISRYDSQSYRRSTRRRASVISAVGRYKLKLIAFVNEYKERHVCADCESAYPFYVMTFDHLPGAKKEGNISDLIRRGATGEKLQREMKKCDVVCANCHAERTHQRREVRLVA